ncbi:GtrA family protein [Haloplanus halobius]|uniref:GtrA family protein n=1 Tax=Haloplanus halobius TaxID=2934938 RepID=UPI00200E7399|nr:GtrA family protein [Haloplanus sp. XH21]
MSGSGRLGDLAELYSGLRFGKFVSVGAVGATAETIVVAILTAGYGVIPQLAKAVGAEVSITLMFLINDRWTFADSGAVGWIPRGRRYLKSHVVRAGGLAVGFLVLTVLTSWTDITLVVRGADLWPTVANAIGIGCGMLLNYLTEGLFTWRVGSD